VTTETASSFGEWGGRIARRWPVVVGAVLIGLVVALAVTFLTPAQQGATVTVLPVAAGGALDPAEGDRLPRIAASVSVIAASDPVLQRAARGYADSGAADSPPPLEEMRSRIIIQVPGDGPLVTITATGASDAEAVALARAETAALSEVIAGLTPAEFAGAGIRIVPVGAPVGIGTVSPRPIANAALGIVAGLLVGVALVMLMPGVRGGGPGPPSGQHPAQRQGADDVVALR
jgi:hypothetical protein